MVFQGPVRLTDNEKRFRQTGETIPIKEELVNSKLKEVSSKKRFKKEKSSKKILRKPIAKSIKAINATHAVKQLAIEQGPMVREVEPKEIVQDNRSLFFNEELKLERRGIDKWLS